MKVLVRLNHQSKQSFLLSFKENITAKKVRRILKENKHDLAVQMLLGKAIHMMEVPVRQTRKAGLAADFVVSDHYTAERLG